jgi:hypothetical protein
MEKNNKKRPRHQSSSDKMQEQGQSEKQQQDKRPKKKTTSNKSKEQQVVDTDLARRFLPSKKRNQVKRDQLSNIQFQLNEISQKMERELIRHFRLMKIEEASKKKDKK